MSRNCPAKRRRGGQPGNQNAKGNRGNPSPRRNYGNRGGSAPFGNQNACKPIPAPHEILLQEYKHVPEAAEWLEAHAINLCGAEFGHDDRRDRALYHGYRGLTPEELMETGQEYRLGLYTLMDLPSEDGSSPYEP
jgi:hypothetical protein